MNLFEIQILKYIHELISCDFLDIIFKFISRLGDKGAIWIVITLILCMIPKTRKAGIISAISLVLCLVIGNIILKPLFDRMRPYEFDNTLNIIIPHLKDGSFPSGHTMAAFAFAQSVGMCFKKCRVWLNTSAVLMGLSRIYLCVHYPTDVIFGALFGICYAFIALKIYNNLQKGGSKNE